MSDTVSAEPPVYDIKTFCAVHLISRSTLYDLWRGGLGPRVYKAGSRVCITRESAREWRAEREAATAAERGDAAA